jgi:hypothetical protein
MNNTSISKTIITTFLLPIPTTVLFLMIYLFVITHIKRELTDTELILPLMGFWFMIASPALIIKFNYRAFIAINAFAKTDIAIQHAISEVKRKHLNFYKIFNTIGLVLSILCLFRFNGLFVFFIIGFLIAITNAIKAVILKLKLESLLIPLAAEKILKTN